MSTKGSVWHTKIKAPFQFRGKGKEISEENVKTGRKKGKDGPSKRP